MVVHTPSVSVRGAADSGSQAGSVKSPATLTAAPPGSGSANVTSPAGLGLEPEQLDMLCRDPVEVARSDHRLAVPFERHLPVFLCATPRTSPSAAWSRLRSYTHGHARELRGGGGARP